MKQLKSEIVIHSVHYSLLAIITSGYQTFNEKYEKEDTSTAEFLRKFYSSYIRKLRLTSNQ